MTSRCSKAVTLLCFRFSDSLNQLVGAMTESFRGTNGLKVFSKSPWDFDGPATDFDCSLGRDVAEDALGFEKKLAMIERDLFWAS